MTRRHPRRVNFSTAALLAVSVVAVFGTSHSIAADRTREEFKEYAAGRLPAFSDAEIDHLAKIVDKDGNGVVSDAEFKDRMKAVGKIREGRGQNEPTKPGSHRPDRSRKEEAPSDEAGDKAPTEAAKTKPVIITEPISTGEATVLLVTATELAAAWGPFAEWKTRNGKATKIVTVRQIEAEYEAGCVQEKIRLCVRDHVDNHGTRWVILGGDCQPGGKGLVPGGHTTIHAQERAGIPTDVVYLSETNWDADEDGVYGEWKDDCEAISYPDGTVGLGRIPVRTADDVAAFTDKVIAYESKYPTSEFAKQMVYTCTSSGAYPKVRKSWDSHVSKVWDGGEVGRFFSSETPWDKDGKPGSYPLSAMNLVALINGKTTGKLHIHGHGLLPLWVLEGSKFTAEHVSQLTNEAAYPLITTVSCFTGQYDSKQDPSIVESMIRQPRGGSVAIVAPVRTGKPHFHDRSDFALMVSEGKLDGTTQTMTRYWSNGLGSGLTTGEALMKAKSAMAEDARKTAGYHLCICELNLLGDPTLDMRADVPRTPEFEVPAEISQCEQSVEIITDAPGATVCVWKGVEVYSVATADADGKAKFEIEPTSAGNLLVTVSGRSLNTVTKSTVVR